MTRATAGSVAVAMTMAAAVFGHQLGQTVDESTDRRTPVGLAIEVDNGVGTPLRVRRGQTFYVNQIDLRASMSAPMVEVRKIAEIGSPPNTELKCPLPGWHPEGGQMLGQEDFMVIQALVRRGVCR